MGPPVLLNIALETVPQLTDLVVRFVIVKEFLLLLFLFSYV